MLWGGMKRMEMIIYSGRRNSCITEEEGGR